MANTTQRRQTSAFAVLAGKVALVHTSQCCRENDAGLQAHSAADHGTAFRHFTEAIRLAPTKAAYHANRAAVALKLGQLSTALSDARQVPSCGTPALMQASS